MKPRNLFMIALLTGTLGVFGCSSDPENGNGNGGSGGSGTAGTGGSGGTVTDPCTGDFCDDSDEPNKAACQELIAECNDTAEAELTPDQCDAAGKRLCSVASGTGGTGGGGGTGGSSAGGNCDYGDCVDDSTVQQACETMVAFCEAWPMPPEFKEACIEGANFDLCGDPGI